MLNSSQYWVANLRSLTPIGCTEHVGAGTGHGVIDADWGVGSSVLCKAKETVYSKLTAITSRSTDSSAHEVLLRDQEEALDFYVPTTANEDGVRTPERIASLCRNAKNEEPLRQRQIPWITRVRLIL